MVRRRIPTDDVRRRILPIDDVLVNERSLAPRVKEPSPPPRRQGNPASGRRPSRWVALLLLLLGLLALPPHASAFLPDELIAKGKVLAAGGHFLAASEVFDQALALNPQNLEARFWFAVTRLSAVVSSPEAQALLTQAGLPEEGRDLRNFTAEWSHDTNGNPILPPDFHSTDVTRFLRESVLPEVVAAEAQLGMIDAPDFRIHLGEGQLWSKMQLSGIPGLEMWMTAENVWIDHADALNLRCLLKFFQYFIHTTHAWNVEVQFETLRRLELDRMLSVESVLGEYPNLLTFASLDDLNAARSAFDEGLHLFTNAFLGIQTRPKLVSSRNPESSVYLFNYDPMAADTAALFQQTLEDVHLSLDAPVVLTADSNLTVHLARHFDGSVSPRELLPLYAGSVAIAGTLDATLGGALMGVSLAQMDAYYAEFWSLGSGVYGTGIDPDAGLQMRFHVKALHAYSVEHSIDLSNWVEIAEFVATNSHHWFSFDPQVDDLGFLRLRDLSAEFVNVYGTVVDACTSLPVGGVLIEDQDEGYTTVSNPDGTFVLQTRTPILEEDPYYYYYGNETFLMASRDGYGNQYFSFYGGREEVVMVLSPTSFAPPPNDDFANRQVLGEWPVESATTCGATEEFLGPYVNEHNIWYEWTAPVSGTILVRTFSEFGLHPNVFVFTGTDLTNLVDAGYDWWTGRFTATQGVTYMIAMTQDDGLTFPFTFQLAAQPTLTVLQPSDGTSLAADHIAFDLELEDPSGVVSRVAITALQWDEYFFDYASEVEIASLPAPGPLSFVWDAVDAGNYEFQIEMYDDQDHGLGWEYLTVSVEPPNQEFADAVVLQGRSTVVQGSTHNSISGGVWYRWIAPFSGPATFQVNPKESTHSYYYADDPPIMEFYSGPSEPELVLLAMDDRGQLTYNVQTGTTYHLFVQSVYSGDTIFLSLTPHAPPTVSLTSPPSPHVWSTLTNLTLAVDVQDADGYICRVDYRMEKFSPYYGPYYYYGPPSGGGELIASSTNAPFSSVLENLPDGNYLEVLVDGDYVGMELFGEVDWQQETFDVPPGPHTLRWRYIKEFWSYGDDTGRAWLDEVTFTPEGP